MDWLYLLPVLLPFAAVAAFVWMFVTLIDLKRSVSRLERRVAELGAGRAAMLAAPAVEASATKPERTQADESGLLERLLGGKLLIWIGGAALVLAAVFLIRYSIEIGLITPAMRMLAAAVFGLLLIVGGEGARRSRLADDPRIAQALVGAGLAVLYATVYGSHLLYGFLNLAAAGALMVAITAAALVLSLRHGAAAAGMGLIGGYLTPWLVGDPEAGAWPLLMYLALLDAAVFAIALRRGWAWIAVIAVLASFAWSSVLLFLAPADAIAGGVFALALGCLASFAVPAKVRIAWTQPLVIAGLHNAVLVVRDDVGAAGWLLFGGVGVASLVLARARPAAAWAALVLLGIGVALLGIDIAADGRGRIAPPAIGLLLIFGLGGTALAWRTRSAADLATACLGLAAPLLVLRYLQPGSLPDIGWGAMLAVLAIGPWLLARRGDEMLPALATAGLLGFAAVDLVPADVLSLAWAALAIGFIALGIRGGDRSFRLAGLLLLTLAIAKLFLIDAAALEGALRILSFLAFGAALIVLGRYYGTLLRAGAGPGAAAADKA